MKSEKCKYMYKNRLFYEEKLADCYTQGFGSNRFHFPLCYEMPLTFELNQRSGKISAGNFSHAWEKTQRLIKWRG
jgi:hypothetical protein